MNKIIEIEVEQKLVGTLERNDDCESPDTWGDDDVFLVYDHRQFYVKRNGFAPEDIYTHLKCKSAVEYYNSLSELTETQSEDRDTCLAEMNDDYNDYFIYPLFAYIHSGVSLSLSSGSYPFNCQFDTSMSGFVLVSKKETNDENKAKELAEGLIETWNTYLEGDIWSMSIELQTVNVANNMIIDTEHISSCSGYYGLEHAKKYMMGTINLYKKEYPDAIVKIIEPN